MKYLSSNNIKLWSQYDLFFLNTCLLATRILPESVHQHCTDVYLLCVFHGYLYLCYHHILIINAVICLFFFPIYIYMYDHVYNLRTQWALYIVTLLVQLEAEMRFIKNDNSLIFRPFLPFFFEYLSQPLPLPMLPHLSLLNQSILLRAHLWTADIRIFLIRTWEKSSLRDLQNPKPQCLISTHRLSVK